MNHPEAATSAVAAGAAGRIAGWLRDGPAQLATGPQRGGVAGVVGADGVAEYAYAEITGYYLQWLAWHAARDGVSTALATRADAAQQWLARWLAAAPLPGTRVHLGPVAGDWRNDAVFFFDVAMVLRGLASAARQGLVAPSAAVIDGVNGLLASLRAQDGLFDACIVKPGASPVPDRWSTRRGAFLAKAAAGVIDAAKVLPGVAATATQAAEDTLAASLRWFDEQPHREVHPLLYAAEGFLSLPRHPLLPSALPVVARAFNDVLVETRVQGRVPEFLRAGAADAGAARVDIVAQALRVGVLVAAQVPREAPDRAGIDLLRGMLVEQVSAQGTLPFAVGAAPRRHNVWAAMFAEQALAFADEGDLAQRAGRDAPLLV
ncbi:MAG: hypothetical protein IPH55_04885 [Betaproteobacteria bacterium]|nr:hypothetical protein [Betaproteobacteria bacterium]